MPATLGVTFDDGKRHPLTLSDAAGWQELGVSSAGPTSSVRIVVSSATPPPPGGKPLLSITEIALDARRS